MTEQVLGIDVGGSKIAVGRVAFPGATVVDQRRVSTRPERGVRDVLSDMLKLVDELTEQDRPPAAVGLCVPELVDLEGRITSAHTGDWPSLPLPDAFSEFPSFTVESDVRAAALAEARYGAGRGHDLMLFVTVGTGISSCLVQGGRPFTGARGNALVLASAPLGVECDRCHAEVDFVLETYASGPALARRYAGIVGRPVERAEDVMEAATSGDEAAVTVVRSAARALGSAVALLVNVLDPHVVVVGGGIGVVEGLYWATLEAAVREHIWSPSTRSLPVVQAELGVDAGVIGAAAIAWERIAGRPR